MSRLAFLLLGLIVLGTVGYAGAQIAGPDPAPVDAKPFKAEAVFVHAQGSHGVVLLNPEVRQLGGRFFIVGKQANQERQQIVQSQFADAMTWFPLDSASELVELDLRGPRR
jgi:hypothetical protein